MTDDGPRGRCAAADTTRARRGRTHGPPAQQSPHERMTRDKRKLPRRARCIIAEERLRPPRSCAPSPPASAWLARARVPAPSAATPCAMPPAKKQKGAAAAPLSPLDAYFARVEAACAAHNCNGSMIVVGIEGEEEDEEEDEEKAERVRTSSRVPAVRRGAGAPCGFARAFCSRHSRPRCRVGPTSARPRGAVVWAQAAQALPLRLRQLSPRCAPALMRSRCCAGVHRGGGCRAAPHPGERRARAGHTPGAALCVRQRGRRRG